MGKITKTPFTRKSERYKELLGLIHTNICGPMKIYIIKGYTCFITFTDDNSWYGYVYLIKHKSKSFKRFKQFKSEVEKKTGKSIKKILLDQGTEYLSHVFQNNIKENGIISQWHLLGNHNITSFLLGPNILVETRLILGEHRPSIKIFL